MKWSKWLDNWDMTSLKLSAGFLDMEWKPQDEDKAAAWALYIELLTRITTQPLPDEDGDEKTALASVYALFPLTRDIIKTNSRNCIEFTKIAIVVLNQVVRPFTAKWHKKSLYRIYRDKFALKIIYIIISISIPLNSFVMAQDAQQIEKKPSPSAVVQSTIQNAGNPVSPIPSAQLASSNGEKKTAANVEQSNASFGVEWVKAIVPLIQSLLWPLFFAICLYMFKSPLQSLATSLSTRLTSSKLKVAGVEFEMTHNTSTVEFKDSELKQSGVAPEIYGNPDAFTLLCKATSSNVAKSTKIMNLQNGCLVQVSTKEIGRDGTVAVAEALAFVPHLNIKIARDANDQITSTDFVTSTKA